MVGFRAIPAWDGRWQSDGRERVVFCGYQRSLSSWPRGGQNIELGNKRALPKRGAWAGFVLVSVRELLGLAG